METGVIMHETVNALKYVVNSLKMEASGLFRILVTMFDTMNRLKYSEMFPKMEDSGSYKTVIMM
jgi:hypothetical protein